jgi:hypothetical protein
MRSQRWAVLESFFPQGGTFSYEHTAHESGGDRRGVRRFAGTGIRDLVFRGPLENVLAINYESQPIGLFAHQVMLRGTNWTRVSPTRFVPPGERASSPTFVEWRMEQGRWVIAAFGDESFPNGHTPRWCC